MSQESFDVVQSPREDALAFSLRVVPLAMGFGPEVDAPEEADCGPCEPSLIRSRHEIGDLVHAAVHLMGSARHLSEVSYARLADILRPLADILDRDDLRDADGRVLVRELLRVLYLIYPSLPKPKLRLAALVPRQGPLKAGSCKPDDCSLSSNAAAQSSVSCPAATREMLSSEDIAWLKRAARALHNFEWLAFFSAYVYVWHRSPHMVRPKRRSLPTSAPALGAVVVAHTLLYKCCPSFTDFELFERACTLKVPVEELLICDTLASQGEEGTKTVTLGDQADDFCMHISLAAPWGPVAIFEQAATPRGEAAFALFARYLAQPYPASVRRATKRDEIYRVVRQRMELYLQGRGLRGEDCEDIVSEFWANEGERIFHNTDFNSLKHLTRVAALYAKFRAKEHFRRTAQSRIDVTDSLPEIGVSGDFDVGSLPDLLKLSHRLRKVEVEILLLRFVHGVRFKEMPAYLTGKARRLRPSTCRVYLSRALRILEADRRFVEALRDAVS